MSRSRLGALSAALFFSIVSVPALARADATIEVVLTDGSSMRGELVERIIGDHVTIKLATGEIRVIPWAAIRSDAQRPAPPAPPAQGTVELNSNKDGTVLQKLVSTGTGYGYAGARAVAIAFEHYEPVCTAPCTAAYDPNGTYVVAGDGVTPSDKFHIPSEGGAPVKLHVDAGSATARAWGLTGLYTGILGLVLGGTLVAVGSIVEPDPQSPRYTGGFAGDFEDDKNRAQTFRTVGFVSIGVGVVAMAFGIWGIASSGTEVSTDSGRVIGKPKLTPAGVAF
ncbi:MAG: hypothetical protein KF819_13525 [Labilithrix sp.]|nr:hypothetical protein [Labilithrix sp.]